MSMYANGESLDRIPISYTAALTCMEQVAGTPVQATNSYETTHVQKPMSCAQKSLEKDRTIVALLEAVGHRSSTAIRAPHSTPRTDTSAMDGFAVNASRTSDASDNRPLRLHIIDTIAAGDLIRRDSPPVHCHNLDDICVEIMTGASFPEMTFPQLDSVVKIEDVILEEFPAVNSTYRSRYIELRQPVKAFQNRRPAGSDIVQSDIVVARGAIIEAKHVAVLASLGLTYVEILCDRGCTDIPSEPAIVRPNMRVGVLSTGSEIFCGFDETKEPDALCMEHKQAVPDSNGPYLISSLRAALPSLSVEYLGVVPDDEEALTGILQKSLSESNFEVIITSGGVSKGRYDIIRHVVEARLQGSVHFHGVKIRPGAPILFASFEKSDGEVLDCRARRTVLFGAPGNPLAAAATLRFFIIPYLLRKSSLTSRATNGSRSQFCGLAHDNNSLVTLERKKDQAEHEGSKLVRGKPRDMTVFWLARRQVGDDEFAEILEDQASYKLSGILEANCWVTAPAGVSQILCGDRLLCSSL